LTISELHKKVEVQKKNNEKKEENIEPRNKGHFILLHNSGLGPSLKNKTHSKSGNQISVVPTKVGNQQPYVSMSSIHHRNIH
jgi:hypothetical protein